MERWRDAGRKREGARNRERERWAGLGMRTVRAIEDKVVQGLLSCFVGYGGGFVIG